MAACRQSPSRDAVRSGIVVLERGKSLALAAGALAALIGLVLMLKEMDDSVDLLTPQRRWHKM